MGLCLDDANGAVLEISSEKVIEPRLRSSRPHPGRPNVTSLPRRNQSSGLARLSALTCCEAESKVKGSLVEHPDGQSLGTYSKN